MTTGTSNPQDRDWFLETSVPRQLLLGHSLVKEEIREHLKGARSWSSFYVLMEYKRSVVKTLIDLYFVALEEDTPADAIKYFSEGFKPRDTKVVLSAIAEFVREDDIAKDKEKFLIKLETFIAGALEHFDVLIDGYVENKTQCPLGRASIKESYGRFLDEIDCKTRCSVERLWRDNRNKLRVLVDEGTKDPHRGKKGFTKALPLVEAAVGDPMRPKTKVNCMVAGDFVIGLEMPKHLRMLTFDTAFDSICGILGKEVVALPSLAVLRKRRALAGGET